MLVQQVAGLQMRERIITILPDVSSLARLFRRVVRRNEAGFITLAIAAGAIAGLCTEALLASANFLHRWLYGQAHLSSLAALSSTTDALIPLLGGLILGFSKIYTGLWIPRRPVDPIEANALHGGLMSLKESFVIAVQTLISNGFGASAGLEAAYTQMGSGFASWLGTVFRLRRADLRMLVACGSAGAISAAFGAPLTGAFYAFELILGTYTPFGLAPVGIAAITGILVFKWLGGSDELIPHITLNASMSQSDMWLLLLLGVLCAWFGIRLMQAVSLIERLCQRFIPTTALRPAAGGLLVGLLALVTPHVLASGHGALTRLFTKPLEPSDVILITLILKTVASAVSLGTGFRGGLFFASLYIGGLLGQVFYFAVSYIDPPMAPDAMVSTLVGMASLAVAVIGAPLAMSFLALEATGNFPLGLVMLAVASLVSIIVRRFFGYSFATWRLHLRGESIRSAQDVGWMRDLTVARLMRTDLPVAPLESTIGEFRRMFPARSTSQWVVLCDDHGVYAGMVFVPDAHLATEEEQAGLGTLLRLPNVFLLPEMNVKLAVQYFEQHETEALAVVDDDGARHVIGLLTEAHVLRRYADELDRAHRDLAGESWLGTG